jgi:hypothetical protein
MTKLEGPSNTVPSTVCSLSCGRAVLQHSLPASADPKERPGVVLLDYVLIFDGCGGLGTLRVTRCAPFRYRHCPFGRNVRILHALPMLHVGTI